MVVLYALGVGCPIKFATGVSCPGCGMTRAWLAFLSLHLAEAVAYHPLFWTVPVAFALAKVGRAPNRVVTVLVWVLIGALLVLWLVRLASPNDATLLVHSSVTGDIVGVEKPVWLGWIA